MVLDPDVPFTISVGTTYSVKIKGTETFRGFLIRLNGGDEDIDSVGVIDIDSDRYPLIGQIADACLTEVYPPVGGICHTRSTPITEVGGTLFFDEPATNILMDVTIVVSLRLTESIYHHSSYILNVV